MRLARTVRPAGTHAELMGVCRPLLRSRQLLGRHRLALLNRSMTGFLGSEDACVFSW